MKKSDKQEKTNKQLFIHNLNQTIMKTKYFFLAALTGLALAGCSSDDFIADAPPVDGNEGMVPIMFTSLKTNFTRADFKDAEAAEKLGNQFVVFGYKGTTTGTPGSTVFDNYLVKYEANTANTTESNTNNWEYVLENKAGEIPIKHATDNGITQQTIKYWDYSQPQYDFIAWSTGSKKAVYEGDGSCPPDSAPWYKVKTYIYVPCDELECDL